MTHVSDGAITAPANQKLRLPGQSMQEYAKAVRSELPAEVFQHNPWRLAWMPLHLGIVGAAVAALLLLPLGWGFRLLLAVAIGHSYGCLMFLAHEILHNTVVKGRRLQDSLAAVCMLPFCIGPTHWRAWHNKFHHQHTKQPGYDPDTFGNVWMHRTNRLARIVATFAPGSGYLHSWLFLGIWFSTQAAVSLLVHAKRFSYWPTAKRRRQLARYAAMLGFWGGVFAVAGAYHFVFIYLIPLVVANVLVMGYVATNHLICEETLEVNDPLANSLSVSVPRWMNWLHLNFGYHVEHHVFPYVNPKHAPKVHAALAARFGARCRRMPLWRAIYLLYRTPSLHLESHELVNLNNGNVYSVLGPQGEEPAKCDQVSVPVRPRLRAKSIRTDTAEVDGQASATGEPDEAQRRAMGRGAA